MSLSSLQLDAFQAVTRTLSFTKAAESLCISQSALSQRIAKLEQTLGSALFIRLTKRLKLTQLAEELLLYCRTRETLEQEFLSNTVANKRANGLCGVIRLAGFSSVMHSVILPALSPFFILNRELMCEFHVLEVDELNDKLQHTEVDYIVSNRPCHMRHVDSFLIGHEENVLVRSKKRDCQNYFLDHDSHDPTTVAFLAQQPQSLPHWKTRYLDDIHLIIEGVKNGLGQAVIPRHLLKNESDLVAVDGYRPLVTPIYFCYFKKPYRSTLHQQFIEYVRTCAGIQHRLEHSPVPALSHQ